MTDDDILNINGSVPVETAQKYLNIPKQMLYQGLQQGVFPFGVAVERRGKWSYDIRPKALVDYQNHGCQNGLDALIAFFKSCK